MRFVLFYLLLAGSMVVGSTIGWLVAGMLVADVWNGFLVPTYNFQPVAVWQASLVLGVVVVAAATIISKVNS